MDQPSYRYDVYISACPEDANWVAEWLQARLEAAGLHVGTEADFDLGVARIINIERVVLGSRAILLVLTPSWVKSGWAEFESVLTQTHDVDHEVPRTIPLLLEPCQPPLRIAALTYADFTQAQRREARLQQIIAAVRGERDIKIIGATLSQFLDNRGRMLQKVQSFWVEGVLGHALQGLAPIDLGLVTAPDAVPKVWDAVVQQAEPPEPLLPETPIGEVFDRFEGALLILGGPGSGKTTLLLQLARALIARAEWTPGFPMPVVFNLSSWGLRRLPLADWIVDELNAKYDVPRKLGQAWVDEDQLIPLLDGLDEVDVKQRLACVAAINAFRQERGFVRIAVACRESDYMEMRESLRMRGAVLVQPLSLDQVDAFLVQGAKPLAGLRAAIQQNAALGELAQTPLMLGILAGAYRDQSADTLLNTLAGGDPRQRLFTAYLDSMLGRHGASPRYARGQTIVWLSWLARGMQRSSQSIFLIERLQPDWLTDRPTRWLYTLGDRVGTAVVAGVGGGLLASLVVGLLLGAITGRFDSADAVAIGASIGLVCALVAGLFGGKAEATGALLGRLSYGITGGVVIGIVSGLVGGLTGAPLETTARPNQGIRRSAENTLRGALVYALAGALAAGLVYALVGGPRPFLHMDTLPPSTGLFVGNQGANPPGGIVTQFSGGYVAGPIYGLLYGAIYCLVAALIGTLAFGGYACISHLMLRLVLWRQKAMPWDYADFLDYCVRRVFLRRVGGGYIFAHRLLMEYFATLPSESPPVSALEPTPPVSTREA